MSTGGGIIPRVPGAVLYPWDERLAAVGRKTEAVPGSDPPATREADATASERNEWARSWGFKSWNDWVAFARTAASFPALGVPTEPVLVSYVGASNRMVRPDLAKDSVIAVSDANADARAWAWFNEGYRLAVDYARSAPGEVKATAAIQIARYLANSPHGIEQVNWSGGDGDRNASYMITGDAGTNAFRRSGAMAMLARYRRRRAAVVGA